MVSTTAPTPDQASPLRTHRRNAGLTLAELAAAAGVAVSTVHELEVGATPRPRKTTKRAIAAALEVEVDVLFPGTTNGRGATHAPTA